MPLDLLAAKLINCRNRRFVIHSDLTIFGRALNNYKGLAIKSFKQNWMQKRLLFLHST